MNTENIACITTFRQENLTGLVEKTRAEVFLDTAEKMARVNLPLTVVYTETKRFILDTLRGLGMNLVPQRSSGMGNIRREAFVAALRAFPKAKYLCWLEPEKPGMVQFVAPMAHRMEQERSVLGMFNRTSMASYPPEQAYYYLFCRAVATQLIGCDIDYAFGPMMMTRSASSYFLNYQGEYGDTWDCILIPRLRIMNNGDGISVLPVNFRNDPRMTQVESGNVVMMLKRLEQLNNVIPSLVSEWRKLREARGSERKSSAIIATS